MVSPAIEARQRRLVDVVDRWSLRAAEFLPVGINARCLLAAIAWQESLFGLLGGRSRVEAAYRPSGPYYRNHVRELYQEYGDCAASSWSSFQIMFVVAWELGFRGYPWDLRDDGTAAAYMVRYLDKRAIQRGAKTVEEIALTYNSGNHKGPITEYAHKVRTYYDRCVVAQDVGKPLDQMEI